MPGASMPLPRSSHASRLSVAAPASARDPVQVGAGDGGSASKPPYGLPRTNGHPSRRLSCLVSALKGRGRSRTCLQPKSAF